MGSWACYPGGEVSAYLYEQDLEAAYAAFVGGFVGWPLASDHDQESELLHTDNGNAVVAVIESDAAGPTEQAEVIAWAYEWLNRWPLVARLPGRQQFGLRIDFEGEEGCYLCPCCAYPALPVPHVLCVRCSCCGVDYHEERSDAAFLGYEPTRDRWIAAGAPFFNAAVKPQGWSALRQLERAGLELNAVERAALAPSRPALTLVTGGQATAPGPWHWWADHHALRQAA